MPGDETRQITNKLEDVIRGMADKVGDIAITQAVIQTKQDATHGTVGRIETQVNKINSRVNKLESWKDKSVSAKKTTAKWVSGIVVFIGVLLGVLKLVGCASPCAPGYETQKCDSTCTVTRIDSCDTLE